MADVGIAAAARHDPAKVALVAGARRVTFGELDARANRLARAMRSRGAGAGDVVAVALRNRPELFEAVAAASRLGARVVVVPWRAKAAETAYLLSDSKARVFVGEPDTSAGGVPALRLGEDYEAALAAERDEPIEDGLDPAPAIFRAYTSGTTGLPKAVERSGHTPDAAVQTALRMTKMWGVDGRDEVHLVCGPLYHMGPCAYASYALLLGQTVVIMERFDAAECLALVEAERVTWTHMVPVNFIRILGLGGTSPDLTSLRRVIHAAAPCPVEVKRAIMRVFPEGSVWEYYGMTEGFATIISPSEWTSKPGSVGRAAPGVAVSIRDSDGSTLPPNESGLVYVTPAGGARFAYAGDDDKTREAWVGDAFTVGDVGYLDEDGYLFLTGRAQDLIISGGANVYPAEVEAVLHAHPAVADCAVVGTPDDEWGEAVTALVEAKAPVVAEELIAWCRDRLSHYKCPRVVTIVDALPREENGKIRKRDLRARYWAGRERTI